MLSVIVNLLKIVLITVLPFCLLIRGAVYLHYNEGLYSYLALGLSAGVTAILLVIYFTFIYGMFSKGSSLKYLRRRFAISLFLVSSFILYGVVFISGENTKSSEIKREFYTLNPILRLGCSTLFLIDKKAIMTDASRLPEDYSKMGLKTLKASLHYKQEDGYVYAVDLRTKDRFEGRNLFLKGYFYIMGFNTLRHVGTADHLHVSMPCRYRKGNI